MSKSTPATLLFFILLLLQTLAYAQPLFEKGYYIDVNNNRYEGYIDRTNLLSTDQYINFKISKKSNTIQLTPKEVSEVFVSGIQLQSHLVSVDTSAFYITDNREPTFEEKNVFLFSLIEGEVSLLQYKTEDASLFFIRERLDAEPYQLIYKKYIHPNGRLYTNNTYRDQLDSLAKNFEKKIDTDQVFYTKKSIHEFVTGINVIENYFFQDYTNPSLLSLRYLNISSITGFRFYRLTSRQTITDAIFFSWVDFSFSNFGAEFEFLLPSLENRFSIIGRGEFASWSRSGSVLFPSNQTGLPRFQDVESEVEYLFISLGFRGYLALLKSTKLYGDIAVSRPYVIQDGINIQHEVRPDFEYQKKSLTASYGIGIVVFNRFSLESRLEFLNTALTNKEDINNFSFSALTINLKVALKSYYSIWD